MRRSVSDCERALRLDCVGESSVHSVVLFHSGNWLDLEITYFPDSSVFRGYLDFEMVGFLRISFLIL